MRYPADIVTNKGGSGFMRDMAWIVRCLFVTWLASTGICERVRSLLSMRSGWTSFRG